MTNQEKAKELVDKFYQYLPIERYVTTSEGELSWEYHGWGNAKQCALIAVDEILYLLNEIDTDEFELFFYEDVKQEIEKL